MDADRWDRSTSWVYLLLGGVPNPAGHRAQFWRLGLEACRRVEAYLPESVGRKSLDKLEQYRDPRAAKGISAARRRLGPYVVDLNLSDADETPAGCAADAIQRLLWLAEQKRIRSADMPLTLSDVFDRCQRATLLARHGTADMATASPERAASDAELCGLIRCVLGNPFRPARFDPSWRTSTARTLAAAIHEERAFDRLPILADALEDAGCDDADVLAHCRGGGEHARGCWVVDRVLAKK